MLYCWQAVRPMPQRSWPCLPDCLASRRPSDAAPLQPRRHSLLPTQRAHAGEDEEKGLLGGKHPPLRAPSLDGLPVKPPPPPCLQPARGARCSPPRLAATCSSALWSIPEAPAQAPGGAAAPPAPPGAPAAERPAQRSPDDERAAAEAATPAGAAARQSAPVGCAADPDGERVRLVGALAHGAHFVWAPAPARETAAPPVTPSAAIVALLPVPVTACM